MQSNVVSPSAVPNWRAEAEFQRANQGTAYTISLAIRNRFLAERPDEKVPMDNQNK